MANTDQPAVPTDKGVTLPPIVESGATHPSATDAQDAVAYFSAKAALGDGNTLPDLTVADTGAEIKVATANLSDKPLVAPVAGTPSDAPPAPVAGLTNDAPPALPGTDAPPAPAGTDAPPAPAGTDAPAISLKLNIGDIKPGTTMQATITVDGQERPVDIHVPTGYDPSKPTPVLYMLGGESPSGQSQGIMEKETGMDQIADQKGFIAVYLDPQTKPLSPSGTGTLLKGDSWNVPDASLSTYDPDKPNDLNYIKAAVDAMPAAFNIDPTHVGIAGFSEGGNVAQAAAAEIPNTFSSVISDNGTWLTGQKQPKTGDKTSALIINGTKNYAMPFEGGSGLETFFMPNANQSQPMDQKYAWLGADQIDPRTPAAVTSSINNGQVQVTDYAPGAPVDVETMLVNGGKNAWDGGNGGRGFWKWSGLGGEQSDVPISQYTADFFLSHPKAN